jgi:hypothetical protein
MKGQLITNKLASILLLSALLITGSCGNDDDDNSSSGTQQQTGEGEFETSVTPSNPVIVNNITTINKIIIEGDDIDIDINMRGVGGPVRHHQHIHRGRKCPTIADDKNRDGYVDGIEAQASVQDILVPLDADINTQEGGKTIVPVANAAGEYDYSESGSLSRLLADLRAPDLDPNDGIGKLGPDEDVSITGRAFLVYGLPEDVPLPPTVQALPGFTAHQSFPICCGLVQPSAGTGTTGGTTVGGTTGGGTTVGGTTGGGTTVGGTTVGGTTVGGTTGGESTVGGTTGGI